MSRRSRSHAAFRALCAFGIAALAGTLAGAPAQAGDGERTRGVPLLPRYKQECAACHVAYPPGLLPAASWHRVMSTLPRHFGTDASLDAATVNELAAWLGAHAGTGRRVPEPPPDDRITRSAWFIREHAEVPADAWKRPSIRSAANCAACHTQADRGDFDEHTVRIPR